MAEEQSHDETRTEQELRGPLAAFADAARPTGAATSVVRRELRRRRRLRAVGASAGAGLAVAAVAVAVTVGPSGSGGSGPVDGPDGSAPPAPATASATGSAAFDCPLTHRVFRDRAPIPDLAGQERVVAEVTGLVRGVWTVRHAEPTALGVVALVQGHVGLAEQQLAEHGVALVRPWSPRPDIAAQVERVLERELIPVADQVRRATDEIPGGAGIALWKDAGAVVLSWKAPPPEVLAVAGERRGVRVIVDEVPWSGEDVRYATVRLWERVRRMPDVEPTSVAACGDLSGLVVGLAPPLDESRRAELQERFAEIVGMPVKVMEEGPVEGLGAADGVSD